jgi:hypothetical protein
MNQSSTQVSGPRSHKCPIPGCNLTFSHGTQGWHTHAAKLDAHPYWRPEVTDPEERKAAFQRDFPQFFPAKAPSTPPPAKKVSGTYSVKELLGMLETAIRNDTEQTRKTG